jgi:ubiquinone/menaquinone biosynthesis C-methylase UbiE
MRAHTGMAENSKRKRFLAKLFREVRKVYQKPEEEWSEDEKELLPSFLQGVGEDKLVLDLAGGYGRVTPYLMEKNSVILADLSLHSLLYAKKVLRANNVDFVCMDMLHLPFVNNVFDAVWFTQAFEYVPPDMREGFLESLRELLKKEGFVFLNVAKVPNECSRLSYVKNYIYWRLIKRAPVVWGDYVYRVNLRHYRGWHYHSVVFTRRIEKTFRKAGFKILKFKDYGKKGYFTYILQV